jgi:DNA-binding PadR family transcriptional regulator
MSRHHAHRHHSDSHHPGRCAHRREGGRRHDQDRGHDGEHERGGGHPHEGDPERGERSSRRRLFAHGDLRLLALHLIGVRPRHGYEIIKEIEELTGGSYAPSPGVIYPTLTWLEELGHVSIAVSEGTKKLHAITAEGRAHLDVYRPTLDALLARIQPLRDARTGAAAPRIVSAMENLQHALKSRLARGLDDAQLELIAAAIDAAALAVDRS